MTTLKKILLVLCMNFVVISRPAEAVGAPEMGNLRASARQICGKGINLQITEMLDSRILIGLTNNTSGKTDFFVSELPFDFKNSYARFIPVRFDVLSGTFLNATDDQLYVIWGSDNDGNKNVRSNLVLGSHTYKCGKVFKWPNDKANDLYGDNSNETEKAGQEHVSSHHTQELLNLGNMTDSREITSYNVGNYSLPIF